MKTNAKSLMRCVAIALSVSAKAEPEGIRTVFAHYMTCFGCPVEDYKRQIMLAQQYGVEGWALNCGNWMKKDQNGEWQPFDGYVEKSARIFQAAHELGTGFKLFFSADSSVERYKNGFHSDMLLRYKDHPNQFRYGGKPFFSGWGGGDRRNEKYNFARQQLAELGAPDVCLVPEFGASRDVMFASKDLSCYDIYAKPDFKCDGIFIFGCDNTSRELTEYLSNSRFAALKAGKIFMAGPCPAYNSSNLRDYHGLAGYASMWSAICADQPELIEIVTWNDYGEDSGIYSAPASWGANSRTAWPRDDSFLDLTAYYAAAYKAGGVYPEITQDKLYAAYRPRPKALSRVFSPDTERGPQGWIDMRDVFLQIHDDVRDRVYATVMLTAPAEVEIRQGDRKVVKKVEAGVHTVEADMVPGRTPEFFVRRNGETMIETIGRRQITDKETERNSLANKYNGFQRVWTGGAVAGKPAAVLEAASGCEWDLPTEVKPGAYAFRVKFSNTDEEESRFVLEMDVSWLKTMEKKDLPVAFTLYLPPTGGAEKEMSFLLTIVPGTTKIRICKREYKENHFWREGKRYLSKVDYSDYGNAVVKSVALVPSVIAKRVGRMEPYPAMVAIPGGTFTMGARAEESDEGGPREVTISPFWMGKYEVTNREFEEFMPSHRSHRTEISWRDRDPVVYVCWREAADYCNWLSEKEGLTPAYDVTNQYALVKGANGYRLPTEAEWEYVATGRGENRKYPWGDEPPNYERCNAAPEEVTLQQENLMRPMRELKTAPVGSYPTGVSRDGIHDLAGNVCEWCTDQYHYDRFVFGKDPVCTEPPRSGRMNFRSIRGGSYGYYGMSQRCCDREFNNPHYRGYIYIGFRVVKPYITRVEKLDGGSE